MKVFDEIVVDSAEDVVNEAKDPVEGVEVEP